MGKIKAKRPIAGGGDRKARTARQALETKSSQTLANWIHPSLVPEIDKSEVESHALDVACDRLSMARRPSQLKPRQYKLYQFLKDVLPEVVPGAELAANWHLDLICQELELIYFGKTERLNIFVAPRHLKSVIASIVFPCWVWLFSPREIFLCMSYSGSLAVDFNYRRRCLIQSDIYQELSAKGLKGVPIELSFGKNRLTEFENQFGGTMIARGYDGSVTGVGGTYLINDDPHNPENVESPVKREKTLVKFKSYSTTRKNKSDAKQLVIMQRTHPEDVGGWTERQPGWKTVVLPSEAKEETRIVLPRSKRVITRKPGDMLHPERFDHAANEEAKEALGYLYEARYGQNPISVDGNIIKSEWLKYYPLEAKPAKPEQIVISMDTASKAKEINAFSVGLVFLVADNGFYLVDVWRKRVTMPDLRKATTQLARKWTPNAILIEDKASGTGLIQDLQLKTKLPIIPIEPVGDKVTRINVESPQVQAGKLFLPEEAPWLYDFVQELIQAGDNAAFMDQVDALSQFLCWMRLRTKKTGFDLW